METFLFLNVLVLDILAIMAFIIYVNYYAKRSFIMDQEIARLEEEIKKKKKKALHD